GGPHPGPSLAGAGSEPRAVGGRSPVVPVRRPGGSRRQRLSFCIGRVGVLTACWVRAELDDRMRLMPAFAPLLGDKRTSNAPHPAPPMMSRDLEPATNGFGDSIDRNSIS